MALKKLMGLKRLTTNQTILLLDLYRGTDTQQGIGTRMEDLKALFVHGLVNAGFAITERGNDLVKNIKLQIIDDLND